MRQVEFLFFSRNSRMCEKEKTKKNRRKKKKKKAKTKTLNQTTVLLTEPTRCKKTNEGDD